MNRVSIVGAGPGAPDLLTLRALERIKNSEVLIWTDSLVSPQIANLAPKNCKKIKTSSLTLEEIIKLIIRESKEGKNIVRLHDGDPCLFGAISEQISALHEAGIEVEVIPGVSAYQATASTLKKELTIPGVVQTIILGRAGGRTGTPDNESLENLASIKATLCLYLSARHVNDVQRTLLKYYPEDTPVIIGYRVSWQDEVIKIVSLKEMAFASKEMNLFRTTLYIISPGFNAKHKRSKLYSSDHKHLFRQN
ncbi:MULTISPECIES: precorrin-4 C(11)-methyltransferase [Prochlorococcus]|uniref:precorrin-4 C(11)-methyltransferase n=1 Tax=Prochlorococcus TaxID=1218 RepID=UPI000533B076|nr:MULTISPECIES: precorrin-4 C(11)-methyltransferase [Prochlorococcus]KGG12934.1 Cobalt-precorrin-4 C11-methyltransferase [Prochlorococcus sp. MIT 0601]